MKFVLECRFGNLKRGNRNESYGQSNQIVINETEIHLEICSLFGCELNGQWMRLAYIDSGGSSHLA